MRRTEQEFKEELLRRTGAYRRKQARKRRQLLAVGTCACICCVAIMVLSPFGASSEAPAVTDEMKMESAVSMQAAGGSDYGIVADGAYAAAPMAPEAEEAKSDTPAAESESNTSTTDGVAGGSRLYNVVSVEVNTVQEQQEHRRFFTSKEKIVPIIIALERFFPVDEGIQEPEPVEGMSYEITVTYTSGTVHYTLFNDGLYSDEDGWIRFDENAARELETVLAQDSDTLSVTVICGDEQITLDDADSAVIMVYLMSDRWVMSAANCLCDYTLEVDGETYRYHSDCGTIQNGSGESLSLSESDRAIFNTIMGRCPMQIDE